MTERGTADSRPTVPATIEVSAAQGGRAGMPLLATVVYRGLEPAHVSVWINERGQQPA
jgi:hypothetical protein